MSIISIFTSAPGDLVSSVARNASLIWQMTKREVVGRYRGSVLGLAWSFFNPLLMLAVYSFVFSFVFKSRWGGGAEDQGRAQFAMMLFVGMTIHGLFAECVNRAPSLILNNPSYVKKIVFPLEILPIVALLSAFFHTLVSLAVLLLGFALFKHFVFASALFLPIVLLPLMLMSLGVAWFLAATGVFVRDVGQITGLFTMVLMFLSPVFYPASALPEKYRFWLELNPLTLFIEQSRGILLEGRVPDFHPLGLAFLGGVAVACAGFKYFQLMRKGFADVL
ncbi:ABC transporter permease [Burkholderia pseudomallei]|uniref:ABC transporter permease n=1 Tax=Burkholderia pseudomallei TaxID=28450 RepID=UPI0022EABFCC|nr:ABC transporter permease [Burkholderia pseudomallei]CAJ9475323.1 polysaccharide ABC transporter permease [Burkholderia pseudomallei]